MRLERLTRGHVVAAVGALVLLVVMAMTWYGTREADLAHQVGNSVLTTGSEAGEVGRNVKQDADSIIARDEKTPWQETRAIDLLLLAMLLFSVLLPLYAAFHRAMGRRSEPPWTPSAVAAITAAITALLVGYRILNEPGNDNLTTIKTGAPLAMGVLVVIGLGSAWAYQREADFAQMRRAAAGDTTATDDESPTVAPDDAAPTATA